MTTSSRSIGANREGWKRQQRWLAWGWDKWAVDENLNVVVRGIKDDRLVEKVSVLAMRIPTHCEVQSIVE